MASPSLVIFASAPDRRLYIEVTKDVEVSLLVRADEVGRELSLVRLEEYATMLEARGRIRKLTRMSRARRAKIVLKSNPEWRPLAVDRRMPVSVSDVPPDSPGDADEPPNEAPVPTTPTLPPQTGSDAKQMSG
jgi:hypothetical protein